jgi:hypothetical protein
VKIDLAFLRHTKAHKKDIRLLYWIQSHPIGISVKAQKKVVGMAL